MNTFIINLNDTIAMSDSAVVELAKVISTCQPCVKEAETNYYDVKIVAIVCGAIVILAFIAAIVISLWHYIELKKWRETENKKAANDKEMRQFDASQKETEEKSRLTRYYQKAIFDKIIAKKIEEEEMKNEEDWKNFCKKISDIIKDVFAKFEGKE